MIRPVQILKDLIESTAHTITIDAITDNGSLSYTIECCNTYYLNVGKKFTVSAVEYTITGLVLNTSITFTGASIPVVTSFEIDPPKFVHGTPKFVNLELQKTNKDEKFPLIWLVEIHNTEYDDSPSARIKATPDFNLLFLDTTNKRDWTIDDHYENVVDTQLNEVNYIIRVLKKRKDLFETEDLTHQTTNHVNFGDYIVNRGYDRKILSDDVSGVQLNLKLPYITMICECDEPIISICQPVTITENGVFQEYVPAGGTFDYTSGGGGSFTYDLYLDGVDTGQDILVDGTNITININ